MKRLFTLFVGAMTALCSMATDYTDSLEVIVNGVSAVQKATISVTQQTDGKYTLSLNNFVLQGVDQTLGVGNIVLTDIEGVEENGVTTIKINKSIEITEGNDPSVAFWMGPMIGLVPINTVAEIRGDKLYVVIDIDLMSTLGQIIKVVFGNGGYQIPNSNFESFHSDGAGGVEPMAWHSFKSATGKMVSMASLLGNGVKKSSDIRPGSRGKVSAMVNSGHLLGITANGTMTTGRLNAGSKTADDKSNNYAYLDMSEADVDKNGDPFYTIMNGRPDSVSVWVKFKQGTANSKHPYATVSAIITDGTFYQNPEVEGKTYNSKLAEARNDQIATNSGNWQRLSIPFTYLNESIQPKAILMTASTNADAGQGSKGDELYLDDLSLIYNHALTSLSVKGKAIDLQEGVTDYTLNLDGDITENDIEATSDGIGAIIEKTIEKNEEGKTVVTVKVLSNDLKSSTTANVTINSNSTGIRTLPASMSNETVIYDIDGRRVNEMKSGRIYIQKNANGKIGKVVKK
ncbi:MAG: PCMD domain-containing protein [Prevotella sp.]|nr:PCMD domain-containing protein [Prevotella sp.]